MEGGLKELAQEVGVTPSYLCRVFKQTMGVTVGTYMKEFEREASNGEQENIVRASHGTESSMVNVATGLLTPATTARSPSAPVLSLKAMPVEVDVRRAYGDLDSGFEFDASLSNAGSGILDVSTALMPQPMTTWNPPTPVDRPEVLQATEVIENFSTPLDLDLHFDFDEWLWTEYLPNNTLYG